MAGLANAARAALGAQTFMSAQFALEMIEGVQKIRFSKKPVDG